MSATPTISIYESTFAQSDKTDAILVVEGKKLHVNRALLSYHSEYFKMLFNTDSEEKSPEFPIPDVNFEHFATVLSFVQNNPIKINECDAEKILELAVLFDLQLSKFQLELYLIGSTIIKTDKIRIADKFGLNELFNRSLPTSREDYMTSPIFVSWGISDPNFPFLKTLSKRTNLKLFHQLIKIKEGSCGSSTLYESQNISDIYERTFAQSEKTDAILVVEGKKLHVNKAVLSYHSDYFNTLFNGEFKEKSMSEIPIEDVKFEEFATLLSLVQDNQIFPTENNAENLLELADRFLLLPSVKHLLELFIISSKIDDFNKIRLADKRTMSVTQELSIFESTFAQSDKTDAILVVGEKKLHVNKALLSYHSTYFNTLFNGEFKEKSMPEIPIEGVKLEDFACVLSFIQENPIIPKAPQAEVLLQLADRFLLAAAKRHVEMLIAMTPKINLLTKLQLADKYNLNVLLKNTLAKLKTKRDFAAVYKTTVGFSDKTKARIYDACFSKFL